MFKSNKGITLVALIITIIVLLILAGVSISFVISKDGVINKSQQAVNEYTNAAEKESNILDQIDVYLDKKINEIQSQQANNTTGD